MSPRKPVSDDDAEMFARAVGGVRRIEDDRVEHPPPRPPARLRHRALSGAVSDALAPDGPDEPAPGFGERQLFARPGVQKRVLRRLTRAQIPVEEELDLHGMRVDGARRALAAFLDECRRRSLGCVRIVTGKGFGSRDTAPVLKAQVDRWLRLCPEVLAFASATPRDGGTGAVYVLLRRAGRRD
jgi:DNA-nicking Smr family endonuclease